jgi:hypothetical protein
MPYVGTLAWARDTGGWLSFRDRLTLTKLNAASLFSELPDLVSYRLGLKRNFPHEIDAASLTPADSAAARASEALLTELAPPFMVNHSLRTYWFSRLIGMGMGLSFDDEALYVASLTHDIGFYGRYARATDGAECFTIRSAQAADEILDRSGWDAARRDRVAEAVILNTNGHVPPELGIEAHLMMRGVLTDATGMHAWRVHPQTVDAVFEHLPLLDQGERLWPTFSEEADRHPRCRGYFAKRYLQFGLMVRMSPWKQRS